jgi:hypothetical protein
MSQLLVVTRPGGIPLDEWVAYVSRSATLRLVAPREGMNRFTRRPHVFHPAPGAAYFDLPHVGPCSIEYRDGALHSTAPDSDAAHVIAMIAADLNATAIPANVDQPPVRPLPLPKTRP